MAEINNVPRFETRCVNNPWVIHVSKDDPENFCPICNQLNTIKGACMIVKELIWEHQTVPQNERVKPKNGRPTKRSDDSLEKARRDFNARAKNPNLRIN